MQQQDSAGQRMEETNQNESDHYAIQMHQRPSKEERRVELGGDESACSGGGVGERRAEMEVDVLEDFVYSSDEF